MNYCQKLKVNSIISDSIDDFSFYNNYIISTDCKCEYCNFFNKQIEKIGNQSAINNDNRAENITSYHNHYNYTPHLNNIKKNLLKNDLYSKKIFSIL